MRGSPRSSVLHSWAEEGIVADVACHVEDEKSRHSQNSLCLAGVKDKRPLALYCTLAQLPA